MLDQTQKPDDKKPAPVYKNSLQLHKSLEAAGLPVISVQSTGIIQYKQDLTKEQETLAAQVIETYQTTLSLEEQTKTLYPLPPVPLDTLVTALWAMVANADPALMNQLKLKG